eukprot:6214542-Amphidinium_carterae.1
MKNNKTNKTRYRNCFETSGLGRGGGRSSVSKDHHLAQPGESMQPNGADAKLESRHGTPHLRA